MRRWTFAPYSTLCGCCGCYIPKGKPVLLLIDDERRWEKQRCPACAGEPVPEQIEPVREPVFIQRPETFTKLSDLQRPDMKQRQANEA